MTFRDDSWTWYSCLARLHPPPRFQVFRTTESHWAPSWKGSPIKPQVRIGNFHVHFFPPHLFTIWILPVTSCDTQQQDRPCAGTSCEKTPKSRNSQHWGRWWWRPCRWRCCRSWAVTWFWCSHLNSWQAEILYFLIDFPHKYSTFLLLILYLNPPKRNLLFKFWVRVWSYPTPFKVEQHQFKFQFSGVPQGSVLGNTVKKVHYRSHFHQ